MHFRDLTLCRYDEDEFDTRNWSVPLLAVGWLQFPFPFKRGVVAQEFALRLESLVGQSQWMFGGFRGMMSCPLWRCRRMWNHPRVWSQENIFVPGADVVYVAPGGIVHYVQAHSYRPPSKFIEATLRCPEIQSPEYRQSLRESNAGVEPPIEFVDLTDLELIRTQTRLLES